MNNRRHKYLIAKNKAIEKVNFLKNHLQEMEEARIPLAELVEVRDLSDIYYRN